MIRLFVGTDPQQHIAERALEASVRANTSQPVDIHWCRQGDPGWQWGGLADGWATPFSRFRWFVPQVCGFEGRGIYMDCDQLVLGDLSELWEWPIPAHKSGLYAGRGQLKADVIVWNCDWDGFAGINRPPERELVKLPREWDHIDHLEDDTKILHFSRLATQVWKPYPDRYPYDTPHPDPAAEALFWEYANAGGP